MPSNVTWGQAVTSDWMEGPLGQTQVVPRTRKGGLTALAEARCTGPTGSPWTMVMRKRASSLTASSAWAFQSKVWVTPSESAVTPSPERAVAGRHTPPPSSEYW